MRYELSDHEWSAIKPMLPNKPRGVARVNDRRVLNGIILLQTSRPAVSIICTATWSNGSIWPSSNSHQYGCGCALMSPRPSSAERLRHPGDLADAARRSDPAGGWIHRHVGVDDRADLRPPSSRLHARRRHGDHGR